MTEEIIGRCIGETSPLFVDFISKKAPQVGEYVYLKYDGKVVLGMIDSLLRGNVSLQDEIFDPKTIEKILKIEGEIDHYIKGKVKILGDKNNLEIPRIPAPPGTEVIKADKDLLREIFERGNGIEIGKVLTEPDVAVKLDVNKMISRHLAILAMTGSGKSNATSIIIDQLLKIDGTIVIFDMHSEYAKTEFKYGKIKTLEARINPKDLSVGEFKELTRIGDNATNQEKYLRDAYDRAKEAIKEGEVYDFLEKLEEEISISVANLEDEDKKRQSHIDAATQVLFKVHDMRSKYKNILSSTNSGDIVDSIEPGKVNIIKLGSMDESSSDILVKHTLSNILERRKNALRNRDAKILDFPVFCILEEAHMLASSHRNTKSQYIIGKIAREGRKFGVGLCLVSQSPKSLDGNALSQVNNLIIMRLVEPGDQHHVQQSSESLSQDLVDRLPALNIGEAVILGQMTKIPTMVKINKFEGETGGQDIDIVGEWARTKREREQRLQQQIDDFDEMDI